MSSDHSTIASTIALLCGLGLCFLSGFAIGRTESDLDGHAEAVREGHGRFVVDDAGTVLFVWNERCHE